MIASQIIMVRPSRFGFNPETSSSNVFQNDIKNNGQSIQETALAEFDKMVEILRKEGIRVLVVNDTNEPHTPDAVFPNNWITTHQNGLVCLFPMEAKNRRLERRDDLIVYLEKNYDCSRIIDYTDAESIGSFLEGTGSIVFDHQYKLAYACRSSRTDETLLKNYCDTINYRPVIFDALDQNGAPIYHTNVMMHVGENYVVICADSIPKEERVIVEATIISCRKELIDISFEQMNSFAGNLLQLKGKNGLVTILSQTAFDSLSESQKTAISSTSKLLSIPIPTIESVGGGSVRCMMAENFLQQ